MVSLLTKGLSMALPVEDELLFNVVRVIGGEEAVTIAAKLRELAEATDDELAKSLDIRLNDVRKTLFKLYNHSIVVYDRIRDENTGWFIFKWRLQPDHVEAYIRSQRIRVLGKLKARLEYEESHDFYCCGTPGCRKLTFEEAIDTIFKCPVCGGSLAFVDGTALKKALNERVGKIAGEIERR